MSVRNGELSPEPSFPSPTDSLTPSVGIVFAPTLNIPAPLISMFLTDFPDIFGVPVDEAVSPIHELIVPVPAAHPEAVRSPRHQMFSDLPTPAYNQTSFYPQASAGSVQQQALGRGVYPVGNDTGFIPMQPSYETPGYRELGVAEGAAGDGVVAAAQVAAKDGKAKRRESGMALANRGLVAQRKSSFQRLREEMGFVREDSAFQ